MTTRDVAEAAVGSTRRSDSRLKNQAIFSDVVSAPAGRGPMAPEIDGRLG